MNHLTNRQAFYVAELASGKNTLQIANDNYVSHHTVRNTLSKARERVGAYSSFHLVAMAIANGWIKAKPESDAKEFISE